MTETDKQRALLACCRPDGDPQGDRRIKGALQHMAVDPALKEAFAFQVGFDREMAARVRALPLPPDFSAEVWAGLHRASAPAASVLARMAAPARALGGAAGVHVPSGLGRGDALRTRERFPG